MVRIEFEANSGQRSDQFPIPAAIVLSVNARFHCIRWPCVHEKLPNIDLFQLFQQAFILLKEKLYLTISNSEESLTKIPCRLNLGRYDELG